MLSVLMVDTDAAPGGDGLAWGTAYNDLQAALAQSAVLNTDGDTENDVDQIWIAEGVYKPSALLESGDARSASFSLVDGVTLYGGFAGTETTLEERDVEAHETTLSGDLGTAGDTSDNAYTVVYCGTGIEAGVDGVSISGGNANGSKVSGHSERSYGGGIYNSGVLIVALSTFSNNIAAVGGGICNYSGTLIVIGSTFLNNSAIGNASTNYSGAGGGIANGSGTLTVINSTLAGNSATGSTNVYGGGIFSNSGTLTVTNSTIACNSVVGYGGGIYCASSTLTVTNSTISGNSAAIPVLGTGNGGGIYAAGTSTKTLNNTIVAGNRAMDSIGEDIAGALSGSYNLIGNGSGQSSLVNGVNGNQVGTTSSPIDPMLSDLSQFDNGQWGYYLLPGSPALDAGGNDLALDPAGLPLVEDLRGGDRVQNGTVDIGAVEGAMEGGPARTYTVTSLDETIADDGVLTFVEAFGAANGNRPVGDAAAGSFSQQDIIQFAEGLSGTIWVDDGQLMIFGDLSIEGSGAEFLILQAGGRNRALMIGPTAAVNLSGITITGGWAEMGGGVYNSFGTLTIHDATVSGNSAYAYGLGGGGIYNLSGAMTITHSVVSDNSTTSYGGGGIFNAFGALTVDGTTISGNSARDGGGIYNMGNLTMCNSTFLDNVAYGMESNNGGGGIYNSGTLTMTDCAFVGNSALSGGGIYNSGTTFVNGSTFSSNVVSGPGSNNYGGGGICSSGTLTMTDCAFVGNTASHSGGGVFIKPSGVLAITCCTFQGNSATSGGGIYNSGTTQVSASTFSSNVANDTTFGGGGIFNSGTLTMADCEFGGNSASGMGGGICSFSGTATITNTTFSENSAHTFGGGIYNMRGTLTLTDSILSGNSGGGIYNGWILILVNSTLSGNEGCGIANYYQLTVTQCTLLDNIGSGIFISNNISITTLSNTIVARNTGAPSGPDIYCSSGTLSGSYNLIGNGVGQTSLVNGENGNLVGTSSAPIDARLSAAGRLLAGSPAINAGSNALAVDGEGNPLAVDLDGRPRILYGRVDMGACEYRVVADADLSGTVDADDAAVLASHWGMRFQSLPGDANGDGIVDGDDAAIVASLWGTTGAARSMGDFNGDGSVDARDASILAANWGATSSRVGWGDGDFNDDHVVDARDASILAANWGATVFPAEEEAAVEVLTPEEIVGAGFVGPVWVDRSKTQRQVLEPVGRSVKWEVGSVKETLNAKTLGREDAGESVKEEVGSVKDVTGEAHDAALVEAFGTQIERPVLDGQRFALFDALGRRSSKGQSAWILDKVTLAVDLLLAE